MKPDLVHLRHGRPVLVVDAKYKAERFDGYPNADAYQLLAYCTALGLKHGHLVYAAGNERPRVYDVNVAGVVIEAHALDLNRTPTELLEDIAQLASILGHPDGWAAATSLQSLVRGKGGTNGCCRR